MAIDGSPAPAKGITLLHHVIHFWDDCDDMIVRHPRIKVTTGGCYDVVNNVAYNWSLHNATKLGEGARVNLVNNALIPGPQSAMEIYDLVPARRSRFN